MATRFATASLCLMAVIASVGVARAQAVAPQGEPPVAVSQVPACAGVLCSLTPAAMDRPIGADDARRMEAERANQPAADGTPAPSDARPDKHRHAEAARHSRTHGRSVAVRAQTPRQRHAEAKALAATRAEAKATDTKTKAANGGEVAPINAIFVLAPRPFDPYGGDYAPWLDRLSWRTNSDRADDRTVFTPDGYAEAERAPVSEPASTQAAEELSRRTDALSQRGFQTLRSDFGRS